jgi:hypothetical protein
MGFSPYREHMSDLSAALTDLFSELAEGANSPGGAFFLNSGDAGLTRSLEQLTAADASRSLNGGATVAAHAQHLRYGLSLMNQWAREGGDPFANAKWDEAWKTNIVTKVDWNEIRAGLQEETRRWKECLAKPRKVSAVELRGLIGSVAHLAYHLGAIRQIAPNARGPREGTFTKS